MKKMKRASIALCCLGMLFWACEKDDICVDGNTPMMIITFHDIDNKDNKKQVENLSVKASTKSQLLLSATTDSIAIPLNTTTQNTNFDFIINLGSNDPTLPENNNLIAVQYAVKDVYVSRACGYVANFLSLDIPFTSAPEKWIKDLEVINNTVDAKPNTHVKIYH
ncbi:MAG: DUF6452 family protein [Flavobacteriaceae bacterium]|nr:DUF6452 family protein [Flavobacteriaceae bacterium]